MKDSADDVFLAQLLAQLWMLHARYPGMQDVIQFQDFSDWDDTTKETEC